MLLLLLGAAARERHQRLDAARPRNRHLVVGVVERDFRQRNRRLLFLRLGAAGTQQLNNGGHITARDGLLQTLVFRELRRRRPRRWHCASARSLHGAAAPTSSLIPLPPKAKEALQEVGLLPVGRPAVRGLACRRLRLLRIAVLPRPCRCHVAASAAATACAACAAATAAAATVGVAARAQVPAHLLDNLVEIARKVVLEEALFRWREPVAQLLPHEIAPLTLVIRRAKVALFHRRRGLKDDGEDFQTLTRSAVDLLLAGAALEVAGAQHGDANVRLGHLAQPLLHPVLAWLHLLAIE